MNDDFIKKMLVRVAEETLPVGTPTVVRMDSEAEAAQMRELTSEEWGQLAKEYQATVQARQDAIIPDRSPEAEKHYLAGADQMRVRVAQMIEMILADSLADTVEIPEQLRRLRGGFSNLRVGLLMGT